MKDLCVLTEANWKHVTTEQKQQLEKVLEDQDLKLAPIVIRIAIDETMNISCKVPRQLNRPSETVRDDTAQQSQDQGRAGGSVSSPKLVQEMSDVLMSSDSVDFSEISIEKCWASFIDHLDRDTIIDGFNHLFSQFRRAAEIVAEKNIKRREQLTDGYFSDYYYHHKKDTELEKLVAGDRDSLLSAFVSFMRYLSLNENADDIRPIGDLLKGGHDPATGKLSTIYLNKCRLNIWPQVQQRLTEFLSSSAFDIERYKAVRKQLIKLPKGGRFAIPVKLGHSDDSDIDQLGFNTRELQGAHAKLDVNDMSMMLTACYTDLPLLSTNVAMGSQINKLFETYVLARKCLVIDPQQPPLDLVQVIKSNTYRTANAIQEPRVLQTQTPDRRFVKKTSERMPVYHSPQKQSTRTPSEDHGTPENLKRIKARLDTRSPSPTSKSLSAIFEFSAGSPSLSDASSDEAHSDAGKRLFDSPTPKKNPHSESSKEESPAKGPSRR